MIQPLGKVGCSLRTRIPGLVVDMAEVGKGSALEKGFNRHAKILKNFVKTGLKQGGTLPDGRRVGFHKIGDTEFYKVFYAPNKSNWPDVSYEVSKDGVSIITDKLKYFKNSQEIIRHLFSKK